VKTSPQRANFEQKAAKSAGNAGFVAAKTTATTKGFAIATEYRDPRRPQREERKHRLNREITAPEVRLNGQDNEPLGIVPLLEALRRAGELDVDLVEITAMANPPVCRLMDYGKFKFQEQKRAHEAKLKQKVIEVKEIKFRPGTDDGDYNIKLRNIRRFLEEGDKCKITLRFRGREMSHQELGMALIQRLRDELGDTIVVESMPKLEGRQLVMMIAPGKKKVGGSKPASESVQAAESAAD
jgi:translation initiation factor IF-3